MLEIGCGNGENLVSAATYLPRAHFVGFDLAAGAIAAGVQAAKASAAPNVQLFAADIRQVRRDGLAGHAPGSFDYVIAHGMYSWVPEPVREDLLAVMRSALGRNGVGFLSINALPGWELRRALRELARDKTASIDAPDAKVAATLRLVKEIGSSGKDARGFFGVLSAAAREYEEHITRATPDEAPFSRYVFHDLLAEHNDAFSVTEVTQRLARAGLRLVCETPLHTTRAGTFTDLATEMARTGTPFLQVLVQRDDAEPARGPDASAVPALFLWADLTPVSPGTYKTTTGALVRPVGDDGLARAVDHAPGFVLVRDLADHDESRERVATQLFAGFCEGVFTLVTERPPHVATRASKRPRVAEHVRTRAESAVTRGAASAVVTSAIHRSFRVPWSELAVVRLLDGRRTVAEIAVDAAKAAEGVPPALAGPLHDSARDGERFVTTVIDRFARHLFLLEDGP